MSSMIKLYQFKGQEGHTFITLSRTREDKGVESHILISVERIDQSSGIETIRLSEEDFVKLCELKYDLVSLHPTGGSDA